MRRRGRRLWTCAGFLLVAATAAQAAPAVVDVRAGALQDALSELARENGVDILYSADLVRGRQSPALKGRLTTERALTQLLAGSGVGYRVTSDGVFVLFALPLREIVDPGDGAISEVLVIGRRTQNADIRRSENDIQPYKVVGPRDLALAPQDSVDQFLRERLPANGQVTAPSQYVNSASGANSAIDLRGIGLQRTLVLVDGRRLPSLPTRQAGLEQSDLNAIPVGLIDRIETLTATAGGIHGPTAIGGVVNLVLKRDYRGADLTVTSGSTSRGDAGRARIEARLGFTPDGGRTDVMLAASYATAQTLTAGQRDYARRSLEMQVGNNPLEFLYQQRPTNAITVRSSLGEPLRLDAAYGGATLSSSYTFLPLDFQGSPEQKAEVLVANAGHLSTEPAKGLAGMAGDDTSLILTPRTYSGLFSVRRRIGDQVEAFIDGFSLRDESWAVSVQNPFISGVTNANATGNLFANNVYFYFPVPGLANKRSVAIDIRRVTGGLIAPLPGRWRASVDYTVGRSELVTRRDGLSLTSDLSNALRTGATGSQGQAPVIPLGDFAALQAATLVYAAPSRQRLRMTTAFTSGVIRAAGPVIDLPGGPLTATALGEIRRERMPEAKDVTIGQAGTTTSLTADRIQLTKSGYVELRAPLVARDVRFAPARGLELQLAVRRDMVRTTFPDTLLTGVSTLQTRTTVHNRADVYTVGARAFPADWLMLRASAATGQSPPNMTQLQQLGILATPTNGFAFTDPKRGGRPVLADGPYVVSARNGWHDIGQEKGVTKSVGVVLNPSGQNGPRLSIDASRVEIRGEIGPPGIPGQEIIDHEELYPKRVVREPLTPSDAALGYTAGRIIALNGGLGNVGTTIADTVDFQLDWTLPRAFDGEMLLYGAATWQPTLRTKRRPGLPWLDRLGYRDGPVEWRGNAGVRWARGPLTLDMNVQYVGRSSPLWSAYSVVLVQTTSRNQTRSYIPSRAYVDLTALRRFDIPAGHPLRSLDVRFVVQNLLDTSPPIVPDPNHMGYDYRSDPRRQRFELSLTGHF